jgi:predicted nucleic acid-binding protein
MKGCTIILPDPGPINSLWVADRLDLLLELDMRIVLVDAVYDELTSDLSYLKDAEVKDFIDGNSPPFVIEPTDIGGIEREKRRLGQKLKKNAGELAMVDFVSSDGGLERYLKANEPVAILFEDAGLRVFNRPPNLHLISTVGLLRGLEDVGVIASADDIIDEMLHPSKLGRRPEDARKFTDLPEGVDEAAAIGSSWKP